MVGTGIVVYEKDKGYVERIFSFMSENLIDGAESRE